MILKEVKWEEMIDGENYLFLTIGNHWNVAKFMYGSLDRDDSVFERDMVKQIFRLPKVT